MCGHHYQQYNAVLPVCQNQHIGVPYLWIWLLYSVSMNSACRLPYIITNHLCVLAIILPLSAAAKKKHSIATTAKLQSLKWLIPKTPLLLMWWCINWLHDGFRTRTGGWEFWLLLWRWHIFSIPLKVGQGIIAETCGLDDVVPPDDLGSGPCTPFIIYMPDTIAVFLVIKINIFWEKNITKVGVAMFVYWMICYCYCFRSGFKCNFSCIVQFSLYHNMVIGIMWHCTLVSSTPSQSMGLVFGCALF